MCIKVDKNAQCITCNIAKKGFNGMRSSSPASISLYLDSDVLRNPFQAILPPLATRRRPTHIQAHLVFSETQADMKNQKSLNLGQRNEKQDNHELFDLQ